MKHRILVNTDPRDNELLHRPAKKVKDPQSPEVLLAVQTMRQLAHEWEAKTGCRAEGLAATQVGINLSILLVRHSNVMIPQKPKEPVDASGDATEGIELLKQWDEYKAFQRSYSGVFNPWYVILNPQIIESIGEQDSSEGCLSVPDVIAKIKRPLKVAFKFTLPNGKSSGMKLAEGYSACVVSHEVDHLNGNLITDAAYETVAAFDQVAM